MFNLWRGELVYILHRSFCMPLVMKISEFSARGGMLGPLISAENPNCLVVAIRNRGLPRSCTSFVLLYSPELVACLTVNFAILKIRIG